MILGHSELPPLALDLDGALLRVFSRDMTRDVYLLLVAPRRPRGLVPAICRALAERAERQC